MEEGVVEGGVVEGPTVGRVCGREREE